MEVIFPIAPEFSPMMTSPSIAPPTNFPHLVLLVILNFRPGDAVSASIDFLISSKPGAPWKKLLKVSITFANFVKSETPTIPTIAISSIPLILELPAKLGLPELIRVVISPLWSKERVVFAEL